MRRKSWIRMVSLVTALLLLAVWTTGCKKDSKSGEEGTATIEVSGTLNSETTAETTPVEGTQSTPETNATAAVTAAVTAAATASPDPSNATVTAAPTGTIGKTATATPKVGATAQPVKATATPKVTAPPAANAKSAKFIVIADSAVQSNQSTSPKGSENTIGINQWPSEADPAIIVYKPAYLKFEVKGITGSVKSAKLVLNYRGQGKGIVDGKTQVFAVSNNSWTEEGITWDNKPTKGAKITEYENPKIYPQIVEINLGSYIKRNGTYSLCLESDSAIRTTFHSKEWVGDSYHPYIEVSY